MHNIRFFLSFRVMVKDPFHANCLPVHIGTLVELGKANGKVHLSVFLRLIVARNYVTSIAIKMLSIGIKQKLI